MNVDGSTVPAADVFGHCVIAREYYDRYRLPIMHTETNMAEHAAVDRLQRRWLGVRDGRYSSTAIADNLASHACAVADAVALHNNLANITGL